VEAKTIIEDYVNKVAANLPRKPRNDIGLELRNLLAEQLRSAAEDAGRPPDSEMAVELLRRFGQPDEVAARYVHRGFQLIEPEQAPMFVKVATVCVLLQWGVTMPFVFSSTLTFGEWWLRWGFSALAWVGLLVVWFGLAGWVQRRSPVDPITSVRPWTHWIFWVPFPGPWHPGEPEATERRAAMNAAPLGALLTLFFIAPARLLDHVLPAGADTAWVRYDDTFRQWLLPPLIALMAGRLLLLAAVALNERWRKPTESLRFGLWVCFVALLYWTLFGWPVFSNAATDALFKAWLLIFLLINTIQIIVWIRRALTRVRLPNTLAPPQT